MRLLDTRSLKFKEFHDSSVAPSYAILSHTWQQDEVTLDDMRSGLASTKKGYEKVINAAAVAAKHYYLYICIDKTSSAELSEAINSMFEWYFRAARCYVYLEDVPAKGGKLNMERFRRCR